MRRLFQRYIISATLAAVALSLVLTLGHTLAVIQTRQQHEEQAIQCVLDAACVEHLRRHRHSATHGDLV